MKSFDIEDTKNYMNQLLVNERFDSFYLYEARVKSALDYFIGGKLNMDYYDEEEKKELENSEYMSWGKVKQTIYDLMKGNKLPINFKIILMFNRDNIKRLIEMNNLPVKPEDVGALFYNIHFEAGQLNVTTGTSLKVFTLDKRLEQLWDETVEKYYI
ncbi:MAG: hypothetical protein IKL53_07345 [Lachnospiraceae bacterium]|nr:hypothetical protein [Lachnospiraceae bacterium]MBR3599679.1 hypothetical protein [Lachnospiraceae bacterium]